MICLSFSLLLLVLLLLTRIDIAAEKDRQDKLLRELGSISDENELLRTRVEAQLSLGEIERRAREELGMLPCTAGQMELLVLDD